MAVIGATPAFRLKFYYRQTKAKSSTQFKFPTHEEKLWWPRKGHFCLLFALFLFPPENNTGSLEKFILIHDSTAHLRK
jgi:hypothetical protein